MRWGLPKRARAGKEGFGRRAKRELRLYNHFLLKDRKRAQFEVVLVSPRNPLNIGAAARAMANFGFARLTVVAPYEEHWREAKSAVGAEALLATARKTATLEEAIADCTLVVGTGTTEYRRPEQKLVALPQLSPHIEAALAAEGRVTLVFGSEKHGLTREDLALCHVLVEIPTDARQPSMNLGQAVAVCLYELIRLAEAREILNNPAEQNSSPGGAATSADLEILADLIGEAMQAADYSPANMRPANRHDLRLLLRRLALNRRDTRRILGLFRRILWKLQGRASPKSR